MRNKYFVDDVSRQQAGDLWHIADESPDPYSNWVARVAWRLYSELDIGERGRLKFRGESEYNRACKLVEVEAIGSAYGDKPDLERSWKDLLDKVENAQVVP